MATSSSNTTQEEILRTLESINRTAANTDQISTATAGLIANQGEQIRNISNNANTIDANLNTSERLIRGIKSWGGRISNMFGATPSDETKKTIAFPAYLPAAAMAKQEPLEQVSNRPSSSSAPTSQSVVSINKSEFDQRVDHQLDHISSVIANIKEKSLAISADISEQVNAVETADQSIARSKDRIHKQHDTIKKFR